MTRTNFKKAFLAATLLIVVILSSSMVAYAEVTSGSVAPLQGRVEYCLNNAEIGSWTTKVAPIGLLAPWYTRLEINGGGYTGPVTVIWKLQQKNDSFSWTDVSGAKMSTSVVLSGIRQTVYVTSHGAYDSSNYNWGQNIAVSGTYRVIVTIIA